MVLIPNLQDLDEVIGSNGFRPLLIVSKKEDVAWKKWHHGMDSPTIRCAANATDLGQVVRDSPLSQLAGSLFLSPWLGVQTPPTARGIGICFPSEQILGEQV